MTKEEKRALFTQAWKEVLGVDEVKDQDSFLDVGGDSIKGVQLVGWLVQKGLKLDMLKIYTAPTVAEMVEALEETQPMAVPSQMLTKDNFQQYMNDPVVQQGMMNGMGPTGGMMQQMPSQMPMPGVMPQGMPMGQQFFISAPMPQGIPMDQQLCTPAPMPQWMPMGQQLCTPAPMPQWMPMGQQFYIAAPMPQWMPMFQQLCTPAPMPQWMPMGQQLCTPVPMSQGMPMGQQLCTPVPMPQGMPMGQQFYIAAPMPQWMPMGQQLCTPAPMPQGMPMGQQSFMGFSVNAPIDNPNTIGINEPKLGLVTKSPEDALDTVLAGIIAGGYDKKANLLDQGLSSLGLMQLITRCAEQGYRVKMEDIIKDPTFTGIVSAMKTE